MIEKYSKGDKVIYDRFDKHKPELTVISYCYEFTHPCIAAHDENGNIFLCPPSKVKPSPGMHKVL